jgi:hypothetical protein
LAGRPSGRLRVSVPVLFATEFLAPRICEFRADYPDIVLDFYLNNRLVDLVEERMDLAIRLTTLADSSLVARRLAEVRIVTVAAPAYLARRGVPQRPADLRDHECLVYNLTATPSEWNFRRQDGTPELVKVAGHLRCNDDQMLKRVALDGLQLQLERDADGRDNWSDLIERDEPDAPREPRPPRDDEPFDLERLDIEGLTLADARIAFRDARAGTSYIVEDLNLNTGRIRAGEPVNVDLNARISSGVPQWRGAVRFNGRADLDMVTQAVSLAIARAALRA